MKELTEYVIASAHDLIAAIDGVTDQFADETARLSAAMSALTKSTKGSEIEACGHVTNRTRAEWAAACISVFMHQTGCDLGDSLGDLLCDLMHWSKQNGFDFELAFERARGHFEAELLDEDLLTVFDNV
jgi:hypothetical protein